jgi:hypothetical protein
VKAKSGTVVLQVLVETVLPTVSFWVEPPAPNPLESDMVSTSCELAGNGRIVENVPKITYEEIRKIQRS